MTELGPWATGVRRLTKTYDRGNDFAPGFCYLLSCTVTWMAKWMANNTMIYQKPNDADSLERKSTLSPNC
jgi:hypothetical protein